MLFVALITLIQPASGFDFASGDMPWTANRGLR